MDISVLTEKDKDIFRSLPAVLISLAGVGAVVVSWVTVLTHTCVGEVCSPEVIEVIQRVIFLTSGACALAAGLVGVGYTLGYTAFKVYCALEPSFAALKRVVKGKYV